MAEITERSTLLEVAATISDALRNAGISATLSGGAVVSIYTDNEYQSKDLDFVTRRLVRRRRLAMLSYSIRAANSSSGSDDDQLDAAVARNRTAGHCRPQRIGIDAAHRRLAS